MMTGERGPCVRACASLLLSIGLCACVTKQAPERGPEMEYRPTWDFTEASGPALLSLWPAQDEAPQRLKRHLRTHQDQGVLQLQVDGIDPGFIWQFDKPLHAGSVRLDLWSSQPQDVQLFWAGTRCRAFKEECSLTVRVPADRHVASFLLPPEPLSELRLDFGQIAGMRLEVHDLKVFEEPTLRSPWTSPLSSTAVTLTDSGLVVTASAADPWVMTDVPGIDATIIDTFEVVLDAPAGTRPQIFWRGTVCPHFDESCSAMLEPLAEGLTATSVDVHAVATWSGRIDGLRLDPGESPGRYVVERVSLERLIKP